jgi:transcriptional regulator with PAS, ATPase and Fis domain
MQPSQDAFNTGIVKLQDFCDWTETIGLDDCPKTAYELALFFKMPEAIEIANSIDTQAPENETREQCKARYEAVILKNNGNKTKAATELGISRALLYKKINNASNKSVFPTANNTFPIQK